MIMLTNFILSAAATICLTVIVGMLAILVILHPVKNEEGE
jgi:hypothetical protein